LNGVGCGVSANGEFQTLTFSATNGIYYSTNYGQTWTLATLVGGGALTGVAFGQVAVSGCGQYEIAAAGTGVYVSNTMAVTWLSVTTMGAVTGVAVSSSGQYMTAAATSGYIWFSANYGSTWTQANSTSASYLGVTMSASGQYQMAISATTVYCSSNYGVSWASVTPTVTGSLTAICSTSNGQYVYMCSSTGYVYYSANYGTTWLTSLSPSAGWISIGCDVSGHFVVAMTASAVYYSSNYGVTWSLAQGIVSGTRLAVSSLGQYLLVAGSTGYFYVSVTRAPSVYTSGPSIMAGNVGMGVGPTGSSFLQVSSGGATAGTGSNAPQYTLDVNGSERVNGARLFADNSALVTATPSLDYTTFGQNWITTLSTPASAYWNGTAVSANGQYQLLASASPGLIYYSSNYGQTWTAASGAPSTQWNALSISASGQYAVAVSNSSSSYVWYSSTYGQSWIQSSSVSAVWYGVAMSASGQYATAIVANAIYYSVNYGQSWTLASGVSSTSWNSVAMSASGQYQVICSQSSGPYVAYSNNYGQTWTAATGISNNCRGIAISASGQYASVTTPNIGTFYSNNYGQTWIAGISTGTPTIVAIGMTSSGQYQLCQNYNTTTLYYSTNYGATWTSITGPASSWQSLSMSSNGQYILVGTTSYNAWQSVTRQPGIFVNSGNSVFGLLLQQLIQQIFLFLLQLVKL
jgi:xyloglucan-specific exo-beta-1,4-glucanase